jgi:hypothetical protein
MLYDMIIISVAALVSKMAAVMSIKRLAFPHMCDDLLLLFLALTRFVF